MDGHFAEAAFEDEDFSGVRIEDVVYQDCTFARCAFAEAVLHSCRFEGCTFEACDLSLVRVTDSRFSGVRFVDSKAIGIDWTVAAWPQVAIWDPIRFEGSTIDHSTFLGLGLSGIRITDCVAREVDFREADLRKADLGGTDLTGSLFSSTDLRGADLSRARNYHIVPGENRLAGAKFSLPEALALLHSMDIELVDE